MNQSPDGLSGTVVAFLRGELDEDGPGVEGLVEDVAVEDLVFGTVRGRARALSWWRAALAEFPHEVIVERVDVYERAIAVATVVRGAVDESRFVAPRLTVAAVRKGRVVSMRNAWNDPRVLGETEGATFDAV